MEEEEERPTIKESFNPRKTIETQLIDHPESSNLACNPQLTQIREQLREFLFTLPPPPKKGGEARQILVNNVKSELFQIGQNGKQICRKYCWDFLPQPQIKP